MAEPKMYSDSEPQVAQLNIGELLASKRHQRGESATHVASKVRLSPEIVEKLESNQFDAIGTAVYLRGYLGIYAKHLGLDAAYIIDQYNRQYPAESVAIRPSAGQAMGEGRRHSKRHSKTLSFLAAGLVVGGLVYGYMRAEPLLLEKGLGQFTPKAAQQSVAIRTQTDGTPTLTTVIDGVEAANNLANDALNGVPLAGADSLVTDIELDLATSPAVSAARQEENSAQTAAPIIALETANLADNTEPAGNQANTTNTEPDEPDKTSEETEAAKVVSIVITFKAECWIKVTDATDKVLTSRIYKSGSKLSAKGNAPLSMVVGNSDAVKSVTVDGQAVSLADYKVGRIKYSVGPKVTTEQ